MKMLQLRKLVKVDTQSEDVWLQNSPLLPVLMNKNEGKQPEDSPTGGLTRSDFLLHNATLCTRGKRNKNVHATSCVTARGGGSPRELPFWLPLETILIGGVYILMTTT